MTGPAPGRRSVAVIGSGVAGLTAAHVLSRQSRVTLIEADARLGGHADTHQVGDLAIDTRTRAVTLAGHPVALTPKEYDLLGCLAADPGAVRSREQLIHDVWDENWWGSTKTLDVHIASLRKKLRPELIETVRSVGYRLVEPPPTT